MAPEIIKTEQSESVWLAWQVSLGCMLCMYCLIFMGLKLRWFRANLSFGESRKNREPTPVTGVGIKIKTNQDDFQSYKQISEFSTSSQQSSLQNGVKKTNSIHDNLSDIRAKLKMKSVKQNTLHTANIPNKTQLQQNNTTTLTSQTTTTKESVKDKSKTENKQKETESTSNLKMESIKQPTTTKLKPKDSFKNIRSIQQNQKQNTETKNQTQPVEFTNTSYSSYNNNYTNNTIKRPETPPSEDENWKIKIVNEVPKSNNNKQQPQQQLEQRHQQQESESDDDDDMTQYNDLYFGAGNSMYSSQAASIFFGGQTPAPQPRITPRTLRRQDSDESNGSEASA